MVHTYAAPMNATAAMLMRTAAQPAIAFWDYLGDLLRTFGQLQTRPPSGQPTGSTERKHKSHKRLEEFGQ